MTRWLITGARGQLGTHLLAHLGDDAIGLARADLDITDDASVMSAVDAVRPDVIVNAAAYTAVDAAETDEDTARSVNATAVEHLARAAAERGARFVHVSTDYVFDGSATRPYEPDDATQPRTAYGRTKLAGENVARAHGGYVVRSAWIYGGPGPNFVDTMLRLAGERDTLDVVNDQIGSPTYVDDLARALIDLASSQVPPSTLHFVNTGQASWFDLAQATFRAAGLDADRVRPVPATQFPRPAPRPSWSVLSTDAWTQNGLIAPRDWRVALQEYVATRG